MNKDRLLQKAKAKQHIGGSKEKAAKYFEDNKEVLGENARINIKTYLKKKKGVKRAYGRDRYNKMTEEQKNRLKQYKKTIKCGKNININFFVLHKNEWRDFRFSWN